MKSAKYVLLAYLLGYLGTFAWLTTLGLDLPRCLGWLAACLEAGQSYAHLCMAWPVYWGAKVMGWTDEIHRFPAEMFPLVVLAGAALLAALGSAVAPSTTTDEPDDASSRPASVSGSTESQLVPRQPELTWFRDPGRRNQSNRSKP